jgi:hypothetical protein
MAPGTSAAAIERTRQRRSAGDATLRPGSDDHKTAFCRMLLDTHDPYQPTAIDWPPLDPAARERLAALPIWDIAVQTEGKASTRVASYAERVADPLLRQAILLNGREEARHKQVLARLVRTYAIRLAPEPRYLPPRRPEWAFMVTGFSECIDSFFAFGLFALAQRSRFFPPELVAAFEPVMQEEARHILFFVNWVAWHRRNLPWWQRPWFWGKVAAVWVFLVYERIGLARAADAPPHAAPQDNNFTLTGSKAVAEIDLKPAELLQLCLSENERRMAVYDPRLLRPRVMPLLARLAGRLLRPRRRRS